MSQPSIYLFRVTVFSDFVFEPSPSSKRSPQARIKELKAQGVNVELITIGNKGTGYFKKRENPVRAALLAPNFGCPALFSRGLPFQAC